MYVCRYIFDGSNMHMIIMAISKLEEGSNNLQEDNGDSISVLTRWLHVGLMPKGAGPCLNKGLACQNTRPPWYFGPAPLQWLSLHSIKTGWDFFTLTPNGWMDGWMEWMSGAATCCRVNKQVDE
jgi:hypothetical protein